MLDFCKEYKDDIKFNDAVIKDLRKKDTIYEYLENVCKALEAVKYVKYVGMDIITDESKIRSKKEISIYDSRLELVTMNFEVTFNGEKENTSIELFIPKATDGVNSYLLNGNRYFGIYQILDSSTYNTANTVTLKSILMPISIRQEPKKIKDKEGNEYTGNIFLLTQFSHKINILNYYLPIYGFEGALKFFKFEKYFEIVEEFDNDEKYLYFPIKAGSYVKTPKQTFMKKPLVRNLFFTFYDVFNKKTGMDRLNDKDYWMVKLGSKYSSNTNVQYEKGESVILSFKRILDQTTKNNLRITEEHKSDIFHLCRWIIFNFNDLKKKDNLSLLNKRFRYAEYLTIPFVTRLSSNTYRILNSKNLTMSKILTLFKISPTIILKAMKTKIELIRYDNVVNDLDLFNHYLKFSSTGFQALSKVSISSAYRDVHPSHLGRIALNQCSSNDPGTTSLFVPFVEPVDDFYFSDSEINI